MSSASWTTAAESLAWSAAAVGSALGERAVQVSRITSVMPSRQVSRSQATCAAHVAWLRDTCREGITLVILDTWTALSPSADPTAAADQAKLSAAVVQLAEDIAGAVVVVDHSRKNRPDGQALSSA